MNLTKLFELQRRLDERIIEEKGLHNLNLLDIRKLAFLVELGELANSGAATHSRAGRRCWKSM